MIYLEGTARTDVFRPKLATFGNFRLIIFYQIKNVMNFDNLIRELKSFNEFTQTVPLHETRFYQYNYTAIYKVVVQTKKPLSTGLPSLRNQ